jgi:uncharacterized protein (DUF4415 family)
MTMAKNASPLSAMSGNTALSSSSHVVRASSGSSAHVGADGGTGGNLVSISLEEIEAKYARGEIRVDPNAPAGPDLPDSFWENAVLVEPPKTRSVHLKIDAEVFQHFLQETGGKGHITRMQAVLKSYVKAQKAAAEKKLTKG